jgi:hypothetical protein
MLSTPSARTPSMFEHLSILTVATPLPTYSIESLLSYQFPIRNFDDLSVRNHLNCGTCDSEYNPQLTLKSRV